MLVRGRLPGAGETLEPAKEQGRSPSRQRRRGATLPRMCTAAAPDRLWIEIELAAEPISGVIHHGPQRASRFDGWLELVALLEAERHPAQGGIVPRDQG